MIRAWVLERAGGVRSMSDWQTLWCTTTRVIMQWRRGSENFDEGHSVEARVFASLPVLAVKLVHLLAIYHLFAGITTQRHSEKHQSVRKWKKRTPPSSPPPSHPAPKNNNSNKNKHKVTVNQAAFQHPIFKSPWDCNCNHCYPESVSILRQRFIRWGDSPHLPLHTPHHQSLILM